MDTLKALDLLLKIIVSLLTLWFYGRKLYRWWKFWTKQNRR